MDPYRELPPRVPAPAPIPRDRPTDALDVLFWAVVVLFGLATARNGAHPSPSDDELQHEIGRLAEQARR